MLIDTSKLKTYFHQFETQKAQRNTQISGKFRKHNHIKEVKVSTHFGQRRKVVYDGHEKSYKYTGLNLSLNRNGGFRLHLLR